MKFAGVVILFNPDDSIKNNISTYIDYIDKLYVVDNSKGVDNSEMFSFSKKIEYIANNENLGIAKALNIGAKKAIKEGYDWLLTMDQDSSFEAKSLKKMENFIISLKEKKEISNLLDVDYKKVALVAPSYKLDSTFEGSLGISFPLMVMTSGNLISLDAYKKIKGFKDWLFIDCVDFDYCLNLKKHGYEIVQLNNTVLNHHLGNGKVYRFLWMKKSSSNHSAIRRYYMVRNRHYIYDMYHNDFPHYCNLEIGRTKREAVKVLLFEKGKIKKVRYMIKGYKDYKKGKSGEYSDEKRDK